MNNIEVEVRSFISKEQYLSLLSFFTKNGKFLKEDTQETYYFSAPVDIRIQKNNFFSKIWLKKGEMHDEAREEIEVKFAKEDFSKIKDIFSELGLEVSIKWLRKRHEFLWEGLSVSLDDNINGTYFIELELLTSEEKRDSALSILKEKMNSLGIKQSSKAELEDYYQNYKKNWRTILNEKD